MKLNLKLKQTSHLKKRLQKLQKNLKELHEEKIYVGYYNDQGIHESSKLSYVDLMTIHEFGANTNGVNIPPRPVLQLTQEGGLFSAQDRREIFSAFQHVFVKGIPISEPLNKIGEYYQQKGRDIFGSTALLPTVYGNPPLIGDTKQLSTRFEYRTSLTYKVQD